jgi:hypothetical protein
MRKFRVFGDNNLKNCGFLNRKKSFRCKNLEFLSLKYEFMELKMRKNGIFGTEECKVLGFRTKNAKFQVFRTKNAKI